MTNPKSCTLLCVPDDVSLTEHLSLYARGLTGAKFLMRPVTFITFAETDEMKLARRSFARVGLKCAIHTAAQDLVFNGTTYWLCELRSSGVLRNA